MEQQTQDKTAKETANGGMHPKLLKIQVRIETLENLIEQMSDKRMTAAEKYQQSLGAEQFAKVLTQQIRGEIERYQALENEGKIKTEDLTAYLEPMKKVQQMVSTILLNTQREKLANDGLAAELTKTVKQLVSDRDKEIDKLHLYKRALETGVGIDEISRPDGPNSPMGGAAADLAARKAEAKAAKEVAKTEKSEAEKASVRAGKKKSKRK